MVRGDLADPASLEPHLTGADAVFLVWPFNSPAMTADLGARVAGMLAGRAVRWEELPPAEARRQLLSAWGDPGFVDSALATWAGLATRPESVTPTVEEVTGRPARTFRQWAADHAGDFRPPSGGASTGPAGRPASARQP